MVLAETMQKMWCRRGLSPIVLQKLYHNQPGVTLTLAVIYLTVLLGLVENAGTPQAIAGVKSGTDLQRK